VEKKAVTGRFKKKGQERTQQEVNLHNVIASAPGGKEEGEDRLWVVESSGL